MCCLHIPGRKRRRTKSKRLEVHMHDLRSHLTGPGCATGLHFRHIGSQVPCKLSWAHTALHPPNNSGDQVRRKVRKHVRHANSCACQRSPTCTGHCPLCPSRLVTPPLPQYLPGCTSLVQTTTGFCGSHS